MKIKMIMIMKMKIMIVMMMINEMKNKVIMKISVCDAAWGGGEADNVDLSLAQVDPQKNPHKILIKSSSKSSLKSS